MGTPGFVGKTIGEKRREEPRKPVSGEPLDCGGLPNKVLTHIKCYASIRHPYFPENARNKML